MIYLPPPTISTTPSPPLLDIDKELSMISSICLPREEYETLTGDVLKGRSAFYFNLDLLQNSIEFRFRDEHPENSYWKFLKCEKRLPNL